MINKLKKYLSSPRGFTLVETMVAVFILSAAIAAPLTVASRGLMSALVAKDQITAYYLAQDAVEYIRFARDTNKLAGATDWMTGAGGTGTTLDLTNCLSATGCYLDSTSQNPATPVACGANCSSTFTSSTMFMTRSATGIYWYAGINGLNVATPFVRKVSILPVGSGTNEKQITVSVYWSDPTLHTVTLKENIFDWQ
jgi:prepilin-type N-terminal cleavage/methylation domain-containing protein